MNKTILKISIGFIALVLAICAAFFSIVGLSKLFAGAAIAVIAMASTLEASKLVIASFLSQYWTTVNKTLRTYLITAVVIIAAITSIGIYGFLSGAYQETKSTYDLTQTAVDSLTTKKLYYESSVVSYRDQLVLLTDERKSIDQSVSELSKGLSNNVITYTDANGNLITTTSSATRKALQDQLNQSRARQNEINIRIDKLNDNIIAYSDSLSRKNVEITQLALKNEISSELGSLAYISKTFDIPMDKVVNILIILFIIVFDPLAITMVLAFNFMNKKPEVETVLESSPNDNVYPSVAEREQLLKEMMEKDQELGLYDNEILPESPAEQPSETGQIQSELETLDIVTPEPEVIENTVDIVKEKPLTAEEKKRIAKQEKAKQLYAGAISSNNNESKTY
jgi:hypothetical protein